MKFKLSNHALEKMERRGIPREVLDERDGKKACQSQIDFGGGRMHLLRAIVNDALDPAMVITIYRTRNIQKYGSPQ